MGDNAFITRLTLAAAATYPDSDFVPGVVVLPDSEAVPDDLCESDTVLSDDKSGDAGLPETSAGKLVVKVNNRQFKLLCLYHSSPTFVCRCTRRQAYDEAV